MNKNLVIMLCVLFAGAQMAGMDRGVREIRGDLGQFDLKCHNGCTAFALTAASRMLTDGAGALTPDKLNQIAYAAYDLYRTHPQGNRGEELEVDEKLVSLHNKFYPRNSVQVNWDATAILTAKMDRLAENKYTILDALIDAMRELEKTAVVITTTHKRFGVSLALGYDHGTWLFYDSHTDHVDAEGAYACIGWQQFPKAARQHLLSLNSSALEAFRNIRITFLEAQLASGGPAAQQPNLPADATKATADHGFDELFARAQKKADYYDFEGAYEYLLEISNSSTCDEQTRKRALELEAWCLEQSQHDVDLR